MSVVDQSGEKIVLPRMCELPETWSAFAAEDPQRWKGVACVALHLQGWPLERIGLAVGHSKGHVSRLVAETRRELEALYRQAPPDDAPRDLAGAA